MDESIEMANQTEQNLARAREQNVRRTIVSVYLFFQEGRVNSHIPDFWHFCADTHSIMHHRRVDYCRDHPDQYIRHRRDKYELIKIIVLL